MNMKMLRVSRVGIVFGRMMLWKICYFEVLLICVVLLRLWGSDRKNCCRKKILKVLVVWGVMRFVKVFI